MPSWRTVRMGVRAWAFMSMASNGWVARMCDSERNPHTIFLTVSVLSNSHSYTHIKPRLSAPCRALKNGLSRPGALAAPRHPKHLFCGVSKRELLHPVRAALKVVVTDCGTALCTSHTQPRTAFVLSPSPSSHCGHSAPHWPACLSLAAAPPSSQPSPPCFVSLSLLPSLLLFTCVAVFWATLRQVRSGSWFGRIPLGGPPPVQ